MSGITFMVIRSISIVRRCEGTLLVAYDVPKNNSFNTKMSGVCVSVENSYKDPKQLWNSQEFARPTKVRKVAVALFYKISALLTNFGLSLTGSDQIIS